MNCITKSIAKVMPKISVIVPVYDVEPYLRQCVESILSQTFQDFELILVDDGSPDNCGAICDEYADKDRRIHVIHQPNGGLSAARNAALDWMFANSSSSYLTFIDSDDWVHERYLELLYREIDKRKPGICSCKLAYSSDAQEDMSQFGNGIDVSETPTERFWCEKIGSVSACGKLYNKDMFLTLRFPIGKLFEDGMLMPFVIFQVPSVTYIDFPLYFYRMRENSITHQKWSPLKLDCCDALEKQMAFFDNRGLAKARCCAVESFMQQMAIAYYQSKEYPGLGKAYAANLRKRALRIRKTYGKDVRFPLCAENYAVLSLFHPILFPDFLRRLYHIMLESRSKTIRHLWPFSGVSK